MIKLFPLILNPSSRGHIFPASEEGPDLKHRLSVPITDATEPLSSSSILYFVKDSSICSF